MLQKDKTILSDFPEAIRHEWIETNGLGGWSSSSIIGCNTRRYHGLLVAATKPPAERMNLLSKLDETIITNSSVGPVSYELGTNLYPNNTIHPNGNKYLQHFSKELFPQWNYRAGHVRLSKTIAMVQNENTTLVLYKVEEATEPFTLELRPFVAARGYHSLQHEGPQLQWNAEFENDVFHTMPDGETNLFIKISGATYQHQPAWFNRFHYSVEQYRGLDFEEDLLSHGVFSIQLQKGDSLGIIISTTDPSDKDATLLFQKEEQRKLSLLNNNTDDVTKQLFLAADQFIVKRGDDLKTIIAGYHWFTDWGRDTMIALPGLCLSTGRYNDAKKILSAFAQSVSMGMLPNRFQDNNEPPEYNNVDGTLWYFIAIHKYLAATADEEFVLSELLPVLKEMIDWHFKGTRYNIHVIEDCLLYAGEKGQQLTWMDARIGDWVVTPRMGKPVEVQALWYNALRIFADLLRKNKQEEDAAMVELSAEKVKHSFETLFWNKQAGYLYDVIDEEGTPDPSLRPNQLFAISLPFPLLEGEKAKAILDIITRELYTPVGLRSLARGDERYVGVYGGSPLKRDGSYHQGTVWTWLLGPYADAIYKVGGDEVKEKIKQIIDAFAYHLNEGGIGSVSEIVDADNPHTPRGCVAQAWGVAEWLRIVKEMHF
ncbi:amylo-alpha-1,6-glucosidase [Lacibacter sediminis]|uniref:Glycogen debranching enzyme family protein n=1 Tax=Lacibacter sediminis TaxID=2760713 RepID=A0A7G5XDC5_9BACT|nr:amylo-alpha-1,6-glucosidase [Lacibacter sediminis]QNA43478.1 glycogen debranching enzyme family protein [Lacibacter sediminis]